MTYIVAEIYPEWKDADGAYTAVSISAWSNVWNSKYVTNPPKEYTDYLKPEFKDKLVITYPNDDDAVLYQFDLMYAPDSLVLRTC